VRALGFSIENGRRAQVSMNLVDTEATPIHRVLALVRAEAARHGATISGCEVVGLIPEYAMLDAAEHALQLEGFRRDQVLELRLRRPPMSEGISIGTFLEQVAGPTPTPGGGTVAAFTGALAAALATMVANLTIGKKKHAASEETMKKLRHDATTLQSALLALARKDSEAFEAVLRARRLPQGSPEQNEARLRALAVAELESARVPLATAEACVSVIGLAELAARHGNPNAASDAGVAGLLARAAGEGALLNVQINLKSIAPSADKDDVETGYRRLHSALLSHDERCREAVRAALNA